MYYLIIPEQSLRLFRCLRNSTKISDAKFLRRYFELFLGGGSCKNLRENQVGKTFPEHDSVMRIR
jgi:hypothetical protein